MTIPEIKPVAVATCGHCGAPIGSGLYRKEGASWCCEACFLARRTPAAWTESLEQLHGKFVEALTDALDLREHETGLHSRRVACHTQVLARRFTSEPEQLRQIYWGSLLHDIGKIGIPDDILLKPAALTGDEWRVMQTHPELGYRIVSRLPGMAEAAAVVLFHEERFDGTGYPRGLRGDAIPFGARLFAVIDTLDAMTSDRSYRRGLDFATAREEIMRLAGQQFDPEVVDAFVAEEAILQEMVALKCAGDQPAG